MDVEYKKYSNIDEVFELHEKWTKHELGGKPADLHLADLTDLDLSGAVLTGADLTGANLTGADLTGANLAWANLTDANLSGANLTDVTVIGTNLTGADLTGAKLKSEDFLEVDLTVMKKDKLPPVLFALWQDSHMLKEGLKEFRIDISSQRADKTKMSL